MTDTAEIRKMQRELCRLQRERPDVYNVVKELLAMPEEQAAEVMRQAMPIIKKGMN